MSTAPKTFRLRGSSAWFAIGLAAVVSGCALIAGVEDVLPREGEGASSAASGGGGSVSSGGGTTSAGGTSSSGGNGGTGGSGGCPSAGCPIGADCLEKSDCDPGPDDNPNECYTSELLGPKGVCAPRVPVGLWTHKLGQELTREQWWGPMSVSPSGNILILAGLCDAFGSCERGPNTFHSKNALLRVGFSWVETSTPSLGERANAAIGSDGVRTLVYGGTNHLSKPVTTDLCFFWTTTTDGASPETCTDPLPGPRDWAAAAGMGSSIILHGGRTCSSSPCTLATDTWEWTFDAWTKISDSGPARAGHRMAFDAQRKRIILFGGSDVPGSLPGVMYDLTFSFDGTHWSKAGAGPPVARADHEMVYDPVRARIVMFGGVTKQGGAQDTWEWDGADWIPILSATSPQEFPHPVSGLQGGIAARGAAAWNPARSVIVAVWDTELWEYHTVGSPCRDASHCGSGFCAGGICCKERCSGTCDAKGRCQR